MNAFVKLHGGTAATALQPIPYRTEAPITADKALSVFAVTIALLAAAVGVLLWARKRNWLQRWSMVAGGGTPNQNTPRILGQTRLGHASHAYVIAVDGSRFVVVESSRQVSLHALSERSVAPRDGHE